MTRDHTATGDGVDLGGGDGLDSATRRRIDQTRDRFAASWRVGRRPAAEDHIDDFTGVARTELLGELLAIELQNRQAAGDHPTRGEYQARFPDDAATVAAAFAAAGLERDARSSPAPDAARNLLFGLLAFQNNFIDREALLGAFNAWVTDKSRSLGVILRERGALDSARLSLLEALVSEHLRQHDHDPEQSLAALQVGGSTREQLQAVGDPELNASLGQTVAATAGAGEAGEATSFFTTSSGDGAGTRFRVVRPHAQGGLGAVSVAFDVELNREVALKEILTKHADDPVSRHRFLVEAEITGGLEHPGIVPVYGLGSYGNGRPYYAMRFIRGDSLKEVIAAFHTPEAKGQDRGTRSLGLRKLLRRFTDICNAIEYAHSRGVLHRDIKPGNVIVGKHGETLVVDWGLAKPLGHAEPDREVSEAAFRPSSGSGSAETLPGQALGTPAYMSPEQAAGDLAQLGARSDVYSLGATLYALLTGQAPFQGRVDEVLRQVQRGEFPPPRQVAPGIDPALEAICLRAMATEPAGRYATCRALADDLDRWLADEPVLAHREPWGRRLSRWGRKHRPAVAAGSVAVLACVVGLVVLGVVLSQANFALRTANTRTNSALIAETRAKRATQTALGQKASALTEVEAARRRAEAVLSFLKEDVLAAARPEGQDGGLGHEVTLRRAVAAAEAKISERFRDQPIVEADVRNVIGITYGYLGEPAAAVRQHEQSLRLRREVLLSNVARLGEVHPDTLIVRGDLAVTYRTLGRFAEAARLDEATLPSMVAIFGATHPHTLTCRYSLAVSYRSLGRLDEAVQLDEETLRLRVAELGPDHPGTLASRISLALDYRAMGRWSEAGEVQRTIVQARRQSQPAEAAQLASDLMTLGLDLIKQRNWVEAEPVARECLLIREQLAPDDWGRFNAMAVLGRVLLGQQRYAEAEPPILGGWKGLNARESKVPLQGKPRLSEAADTVIQLYEAWGKPQSLAAWKSKLGLIDLPEDVFAPL